MKEGHIIYLMRNGEQTGPFTENELRRYWGYGSVSEDDLVWAQGMPDYVTLGEYFTIHGTRRVAQRMPRTLVLQGGNEAWDSPEPENAVHWQANAWVFQALGWILLLVATAFWISFPKQIIMALIIYVLALFLVVVYLVIRRSFTGWLALTCSVALPVALWFHLGSARTLEKPGLQMPVSSSQPTAMVIPDSRS